jgi:hypothetical protein
VRVWGAAVPWHSMAALLNLNHHAGFAHWHFFAMSVPNIIVIVLTFIVFAVAILAPFPGVRHRGGTP